MNSGFLFVFDFHLHKTVTCIIIQQRLYSTRRKEENDKHIHDYYHYNNNATILCIASNTDTYDIGVQKSSNEICSVLIEDHSFQKHFKRLTRYYTVQ